MLLCPRMTSVADWLVENGAHHDVVEWAKAYGDDWERMWRECPRGDWMLGIAAKKGAPREAIVHAAHACAFFALDYLPDDDGGVRAALDATTRWLNGHQHDVDERARIAADVDRAIDAMPDPAAH